MGEIFFADDDGAMRQMVGDLLRAAGYDVRLASSGAAALEEVRRQPPDLVVLDYRMGSPNGFEVCQAIKSDPRLEHLPVLILTGEGEIESRLSGFDAGADDYLPKPFDPRELLARVRALLRLIRQGLDRQPGTGLPGGTAIQREFDRRRELGKFFCVCYLDLDHFKPFADRFGFATADALIGEIARGLETVVSSSGPFAGHIGGDDFVLFAECAEARDLVRRIQAHFRGAIDRILPEEVVRAGSFDGVDRYGVPRTFPLSRVTAAVIRVDPERAGTLAELSELIAETKSRAKQSASDGIVEAVYPPDGSAAS